MLSVRRTLSDSSAALLRDWNFYYRIFTYGAVLFVCAAPTHRHLNFIFRIETNCLEVVRWKSEWKSEQWRCTFSARKTQPYRLSRQFDANVGIENSGTPINDVDMGTATLSMPFWISASIHLLSSILVGAPFPREIHLKLQNDNENVFRRLRVCIHHALVCHRFDAWQVLSVLLVCVAHMVCVAADSSVCICAVHCVEVPHFGK